MTAPGRGEHAASEYTIVEYEPRFKEQIVDLQRGLWSPDPALNRAYFEWKHERNPYFQSPRVLIGLEGGRVVGMRSLLGTCWEIGARTPPVLLPYPDDFMIAPESRGSGLARRLMEGLHERAAAAGFPYLLNMSASPVTTLESLATGWKSAGAVEPVGLELGPGSRLMRARQWVREAPGVRRTVDVLHLRRVVRAGVTISERVGSPFHHLDHAAGGDAELGAITVERVPRPEAMAGLVERIGHDGRIRHRRDPEYLAWRYEDPLREYRFLFLEGDGLAGYLVLKREVGGGRVYVVDWEALEPAGLRELLRFALAEGGVEQITAWEAAVPEHGRAVLREHGFVPIDPERRRRGQPCVLVRPATEQEGEWRLGEHALLDPASWDLRLIYSMV